MKRAAVSCALSAAGAALSVVSTRRAKPSSGAKPSRVCVRSCLRAGYFFLFVAAAIASEIIFAPSSIWVCTAVAFCNAEA